MSRVPQKNHLNEMVVLSTQHICLYWLLRKYFQFKAQNLCSSKPVFLVLQSMYKKTSTKLQLLQQHILEITGFRAPFEQNEFHFLKFAVFVLSQAFSLECITKK